MRIKRTLAVLATAAVGSLAMASSASAALVVTQACSSSNITVAAGVEVDPCGGWYQGNLNGGSPAQTADAQAAINALVGEGESPFTGTGFGNFDTSSQTVHFATPLTGDVIVAFHVGAANGQPGGIGTESTAFFPLDIPAGQSITQITVNVPGLSNAEVWENGGATVPEPATWALILIGVGALGATLRASNRKAAALEPA